MQLVSRRNVTTRRKLTILATTAAAAAVVVATAPTQSSLAFVGGPHGLARPAGLAPSVAGSPEGSAELYSAMQQYSATRTAPAASVSSEAFHAAAVQAKALPTTG